MITTSGLVSSIDESSVGGNEAVAMRLALVELPLFHWLMEIALPLNLNRSTC